MKSIQLTKTEFFLNKLYFKINNEILFIVMIIGLCFNFFTSSIFMFRKRFHLKGNTMGYFFTLQPLFSSMSLLTMIIFNIILRNNEPTDKMCGTVLALACFFVVASGFFQFLITFDRYISVLHPSKHLKFKRKQNLIALTISSFVGAIPAAITMSFQHAEKRDFFYKNVSIRVEPCIIDDENHRIIVNLVILTSRIIPTILMFILNIKICKRLFESKSKISKNDRSMKREKNFTITILSLNLIYFLTFIPIIVFNSLLVYNSSYLFYILSSYSRILIILNETSPFFINVLINKIFKNELKLLFFCFFKPKEENTGVRV
jgi:hypothetical protein